MHIKRISKITSKSGYKGVTFRANKKKNQYEAHFTVPIAGKHVKVHVGSYQTALDASMARLSFIESLKG